MCEREHLSKNHVFQLTHVLWRVRPAAAAARASNCNTYVSLQCTDNNFVKLWKFIVFVQVELSCKWTKKSNAKVGTQKTALMSWTAKVDNGAIFQLLRWLKFHLHSGGWKSPSYFLRVGAAQQRYSEFDFCQTLLYTVKAFAARRKLFLGLTAAVCMWKRSVQDSCLWEVEQVTQSTLLLGSQQQWKACLLCSCPTSKRCNHNSLLTLPSKQASYKGALFSHH